LPPDRITQHTLVLGNRTLRFNATAGVIRPTGGRAAPLAEIAFTAYQLDGAEAAQRPVSFAFNGGPGFASAWLQVGAAGPWRIDLGPRATYPSAPAEPMPNADTWLDFTDLVFIDPAGTGYSRALVTGETAQRLWSVDGDIAYLAETIRRWLDKFDRATSPKYILGESYGGFRAPRLAQELAARHGVGVAGLMLVSPALEVTQRSIAFDPFYYVTRLPSMAAAARALHGPVTRDALVDVEQYAATDYLLDVTRGARDAAAIDRRSARVAAFTGIDPALVRRHDGLLDDDVFLRALDRARHRVASPYDATISSADPFPLEDDSSGPDAVLGALKAPVSSAMVAIYESKLQWRPDSVYQLFNPSVTRQWEWGSAFGTRPQSVQALRTVLALDDHLRVLIAQGLFDLVVPYFSTQLMLDQIPASVGMDRVRFTLHPGGHMLYTNDASRAALHDEAAAMVRVV
jgi:carboxypeptidase C (cathepsin A)